MVLDALGGVLGEAVGILISPLPIVAVILMLFSRRAVANGLAFLAGWVLALAAVGTVVFLLAGTADVSGDAGARDGSGTLQIVLGIILILMAGRRWRSRPQPGETPPPPKWMARIDGLAPGGAFVLGVLFAGVNPKNLILAVAAATIVAQAGLGGADTAVTWAVFVLLASLGVMAPVVYRLVRGAHAQATLDAARGWLELHNAAVMAVLFLVFGAKILGTGLGVLS